MNLNLKKQKICLVTTTLSGGGAEKVAADLSVFFDKQGFEVYHVVFAGKIEYAHAGKVYHLVDETSKGFFSRINRFLKLKNIFKTEKFDVVIDFRTKLIFWQEFIINKWVYKNFIQTIHSYKTSSYLPKNKFLTELLYKKKQCFVCVSNEIKNKINHQYQYTNVNLIYNPLHLQFIEKLKNEILNETNKYLLAVGSFNKNTKQFDKLIKMYAVSELPKNNIKLMILGEGKLKLAFEKLANSLNLSHLIEFKGNVSNPFQYYSNALFTVSVSKYEGFPMVIIESLACNTPVISWDYSSGPIEIIETGKNGILVENNNEEALIEAMNKMVTDKVFYENCKNGTKNSVEKFNLEIIGQQWLNLIENETNY